MISEHAAGSTIHFNGEEMFLHPIHPWCCYVGEDHIPVIVKKLSILCKQKVSFFKNPWYLQYKDSQMILGAAQISLA